MDLTTSFRRLVRIALGLDEEPGKPPQIDQLAFYRAEVKACASDGSTVDLQPEDSRIKGHQQVPVRTGVPGLVAVVQPGAIVHLGWIGGDPSKPVAVPIWESATTTKLVLAATTVYLGAESGAQFVALANLVASELSALKAAISGAAVAAYDGGATFKANILAALTNWPGSVAADLTKAK